MKEKEPTPDERERVARRIKILEEFFQFNEINPNEAVALSMHFIALQTGGVVEYEFIEKLFRQIWRAVERGEL